MKRGDQVDIFDDDSQRLIEPIHRVVSLLVECLQKIGASDKRLEVTKQSIATDAGLFTATELIELLEHRIDLFAEKGEQMDAKARNAKLMELVKALDHRIQQASEDGSLDQHPKMIRILKKWHRYGRKAKVQQWLATHCQDDRNFVNTLLSIANDKALLSDKDRAAKTDIPLELIQSFFETKELLQRANRICDEEPEWVPLEGELLLSSIIDLLGKLPAKSAN